MRESFFNRRHIEVDKHVVLGKRGFLCFCLMPKFDAVNAFYGGGVIFAVFLCCFFMLLSTYLTLSKIKSYVLKMGLLTG